MRDHDGCAFETVQSDELAGAAPRRGDAGSRRRLVWLVSGNPHKGTIIQFLGDAIFAMWNAPAPTTTTPRTPA